MDSIISKTSQFHQSLIALKNSVLSLCDELVKILHKCIEEADMIVTASANRESVSILMFVNFNNDIFLY